MGGNQSRAVLKKGPTTVTLSPPSSPFLVGERRDEDKDGHGVVSSLIGALSAASLGASSRLPSSLLLLKALLSGSASEDLRLFFSEKAFAMIFPDLADMRLDLLALGDMIQVSRQNIDSMDMDYYLAAKVSCLTDPHNLFSCLMMICVQEMFRDATVAALHKDLQLRHTIMHDLTILLLKRIVNALNVEDAPTDLPSVPFIRGLCNKFEFVLASLNALLGFKDLDRFIPDHQTFNDNDFENSLFELLVCYSCFLYRQKRFMDVLDATTVSLELYNDLSLAMLPQSRLQFVQCKALIWLGNGQSSMDVARCIESSIPEFIDLMNEPPSTGIISKYEDSREHFYYLLMSIASDAGCKKLGVDFGQSALLHSTVDSELGLVVAMTIFVSLLDEHQWLEAYESIRAIHHPEKRQDCIQRFLSVLCEHEDVAADVLCSLPLVGSFNLVEEWLLLKARQSASNVACSNKRFKFFHHLLFIVYMNHGDYRGAAGSMYRLSERLPAKSVEKKRCLLLSVSCLELVHPDFQWIAMTKEVEEQDERQLFMLSLSDVRLELEDCSAIEDLDSLISRGSYQDAFRIASHDFESLVRLCRYFVNKNDQSLVQYLRKLPIDIQCRLILQSPDCDWLTDYLKQLKVNAYLRHFCHDAAAVLNEHVEQWRSHKRCSSVPRPRDIISSTVIPDELKDKHQEYLNEIQ